MSNKTSGKFETLEVWKVARSFRNTITTLVNSFSEEERYLLKYQLIKSSRAVGSSIAKGYGSDLLEDMIHFCRIARGHLQETMDGLFTALDEKYISIQTFNLLQKEHEHLLKLLNGYISYLKKQEDMLSDDLDILMDEAQTYATQNLLNPQFQQGFA